MGNVPFLDFQAIKRSYSIEEIMGMTALPFKKDGKSYRCQCPVHNGGKRGLVVTPDERDDKGDAGVFYCFGEKAGGDRVALLAHVRDSKPYVIFKELHEKRPIEKKAEPKPRQVLGVGDENRPPENPTKVPEEKEEGKRRGMPPLPYLKPEHEAIQAIGIQPEIANVLGIGFAPGGHHKGRLALPLRLADGTLAGYISLPLGCDIQLPPKWHL